MRTSATTHARIGGAMLAAAVLAANAGPAPAKDHSSQVSSNDATVRLYNLLDSKFNGKVDQFCMLADLVNDPKSPGQQVQRVICADYNKERGFDRLSVHVRTVAPLSPEQLKAYSPKQVFEFAETDSAKYMKTDPGTFGRAGDVYFEAAADGGPLSHATVTSEIQGQYDTLINQYLLPALEKNTTEATRR